MVEFLPLVEAPAEFTTPLADQKVKEFETAQFECQVSKKDLKVKWTKDTVELKSDDKYKMTSVGYKHILAIKDSQLEDQCNYTIVVEEGVEATAKLTVEGTLFISLKTSSFSLTSLEIFNGLL